MVTKQIIVVEDYVWLSIWIAIIIIINIIIYV